VASSLAQRHRPRAFFSEDKGEIKMSTATMTQPETKKFHTAPLNWKEVWYTNCPLVSASNIDQELGWTREEYKKIGVKYDYFRNTRENDFYPHYIHNLDNLIRFGGLFPPIQVHADLRRTRLLETHPGTRVFERKISVT
jgi:hypothetical protein